MNTKYIGYSNLEYLSLSYLKYTQINLKYDTDLIKMCADEISDLGDNFIVKYHTDILFGLCALFII
jgi:hypothetical protein